MTTKRTIATLTGCGIGDALGNPWEMKSFSHKPLQEWDGFFKDGGTFFKTAKAGQYTDDTIATMCLAVSLIRRNGFDPADVANEYLDWFNGTNHRGTGSTTAEALFHLRCGATWETSGITSPKQAGNGTAMRVSPIGLVYRKNWPGLIKAAMQDAMITHNSAEPIAGSIVVALGTALLAENLATPANLIETITSTMVADNITGHLLQTHLAETQVYKHLLLAQKLVKDNAPLDQVVAELGAVGKLRGWVPETVGAAFYCLTKNTNFQDTVVMAVKMGGDGDTNAAIAGALAGTYYGLEGIPIEYHCVEKLDVLNQLSKRLMELDI